MEISKIFPYFLFVIYSFYFSYTAEVDSEDHLLCRHCGHEVAKAPDLTDKPSIRALRQRNETILNQPEILIQLFRNPHGTEFELITASTADIYKVDKPYAMDSWYPGFTWQVVACPRCGFHLGWLFQPLYAKDKQSFVGLILSNLLHNSYADDLIVVLDQVSKITLKIL